MNRANNDRQRRPLGEGSVFQRSQDDRWVVQVTRKEPPGLRRTRYRVKYARTESEAYEILEELLEEEGWQSDTDQ